MQFSSLRQRVVLPAIAAISVAFVLPFALPPPVSAQDDGAPGTSGFAARIDSVGGDVAIQRGDDNETLAAVPNAPVLAGDYVTTGAQSLAEVGFDGHSAVRLGENVQMRFTGVDPANRQVQLAAGGIEVRLFGDTDGRSAIDTPSISVVPRTAGSFRVEVDANGETAVTVRAGRADVVSPQGNQSLEPGTTLIADGPAANPSIRLQPAFALDAFDAYNGERDRIYVAASAGSPDVNTTANGRWYVGAAYQGPVWYPAPPARIVTRVVYGPVLVAPQPSYSNAWSRFMRWSRPIPGRPVESNRVRSVR